MDNKEFNINEVVRLETLPVIFQQLELVGKYVDEEIEKVKDLKCTEENKQEIKKIRTGINSIITQFETKRKEIKNQCLLAYNQFNEKYEQEVKDKLENASNDLKIAIDKIEIEQLKEKEQELFDFIDEYIRQNHIESLLMVSEVVRFANLKINLSTSLKSLKEDAKDFVEKVANEIKLIGLEEYRDEILLEYTKKYDYTNAKLNVINRYKQLEQLSKQRENVKEVVEQEEKNAEIIEEITTPKEIIEDNTILEVSFKIKTTKEKILKLKEFLKEENIIYE